MIPKNELRIGNWIYPTEENATPYPVVELLESDGISYKSQGLHRYDEDVIIPYFLAEPIPITEEWLLRLGFRTFDGTIYGMQIGNYHVQIFYYDCWNLTIESDNEKCELQNYWAVHNLQNIIFEITNEELIAHEQK